MPKWCEGIPEVEEQLFAKCGFASAGWYELFR